MADYRNRTCTAGVLEQDRQEGGSTGDGSTLVAGHNDSPNEPLGSWTELDEPVDVHTAHFGKQLL
jgi:hypothetical protein